MFFILMITLNLQLQTPSEKIPLLVQVPESTRERTIGLSKTKHLPASEGMLFIFDQEGYYPFTMKKTSVPLAFFFFNAEMKLIETHIAKPYTTTHVIPQKKCQFVLEANPGLLQKYSFPLNTTILHFSKKRLDD